MLRLKSNLLTKVNDQWHYQNQLFTGVIFFDKEDCIVEPFYVENGVITCPYVSPCQQGLPSPIQIDCTGFWNQDEDIFEVGGVPQFYKGNFYNGMCYAFEDGICIGENYTLENGVTESRVLWNKKTQEPRTLEMTTSNNEWIYYNDLEKTSFLYTNLKLDDRGLEVNVSYYKSNMRVSSFSVAGDVMGTECYKNVPIPLPKIYDVLENYESYVFTEFFIIYPNEFINEDLIKTWISNHSFEFTEFLVITGNKMLEDLSLFNNRQAFPKLKKLTFRKDTRREEDKDETFSLEERLQINELIANKPNFKVEIE